MNKWIQLMNDLQLIPWTSRSTLALRSKYLATNTAHFNKHMSIDFALKGFAQSTLRQLRTGRLRAFEICQFIWFSGEICFLLCNSRLLVCHLFSIGPQWLRLWRHHMDSVEPFSNFWLLIKSAMISQRAFAIYAFVATCTLYFYYFTA